MADKQRSMPSSKYRMWLKDECWSTCLNCLQSSWPQRFDPGGAEQPCFTGQSASHLCGQSRYSIIPNLSSDLNLLRSADHGLSRSSTFRVVSPAYWQRPNLQVCKESGRPMNRSSCSCDHSYLLPLTGKLPKSICFESSAI